VFKLDSDDTMIAADAVTSNNAIPNNNYTRSSYAYMIAVDAVASTCTIPNYNSCNQTGRIEVHSVRERRYLRCDIAKIMNGVSPGDTNIARSLIEIELVLECVTLLIARVTAEAFEECQSNNQGTIQPGDISGALSKLGVDESLESVRDFIVATYGDTNTISRNSIHRTMKSVLPRDFAIGFRSIRNFQESVPVFISLITEEANERRQLTKRKRINCDDLLIALSTSGFQDFVEPMKAYLRFRRDTVKNTSLARAVTQR
jgi:nuclear transcription Y subunit beta